MKQPQTTVEFVRLRSVTPFSDLPTWLEVDVLLTEIDRLNALVEGAREMPEAQFKLALKREGTEDEATFEINGSSEWLERILPFVGLTITGVTKAFGLDRAHGDQVRREIDRAHEYLRLRRNYVGEFVRTNLRS